MQRTNSAGTITDTYEYDAFGNKINSTGTTPNSYLYRGEQYDPDLGLYYLRARYYNPLTGRFMSRDLEDGQRSDPSTLHKYLYAGGDPVNAKDPSGRASEEEEPLIDVQIMKNVRAVLRFAKQVDRFYACLEFGTSLIIQKIGLPFDPALADFAIAECLKRLAAPFN